MKILRKYRNFAPWDAAGMAAHLEEMEARGWRFRGIGRLGLWEYEKCQPTAARWAVAYAPSYTDWRVSPTEPERNLEFLCFDAGWRKIEALSGFHIYRNPDPNCTPLESDELPRLDTLDRTLHRPMLIRALIWTFFSLLMLALLIRSIPADLPRTLAQPALPGTMLYLLWLPASQLVPLGMYRNWLRSARNAAAAELPCPSIGDWERFSRWNRIIMAVLFVWIISIGEVLLLLIYAAIFAALALLRWLLPRMVRDEDLADQFWQCALVAAIIAISGLYLWHNRTDNSDHQVDTIPLMAVDLMDTTGMELQQFDFNDSEAPWASYHDYWQAGDVNIQYDIFDYSIPLFRDICEADFLETFDWITDRDGMSVTEADAALWGAEQVFFSTMPGRDQWLIFYDSRIVHIHTNWNMTPDQIAAAGQKLAP